MDGSQPIPAASDLPAPTMPGDTSVPAPAGMPSTDLSAGQYQGQPNAGQAIPSVTADPAQYAQPVGGGSAIASPQVAEDVDLIEKEWVLKAKAIVAKTRDDPRQQSTEINQMKADYLKKRYSKDVKVNES